MTYEQLKQYAADLGVTWDVRTHDAGQAITLTGAKGYARYNIEWGQEQGFYPIMKSWLDSQPWPTEDDPRVREEQAYLPTTPWKEDDQ